MKPLALLTIALLSVGVSTAGAAALTVTVGSGPTAADIPIPAGYTTASNGSVSWGNYTWSSTNLYNGGGAVFGYTGGLGFGSNGSWDSAVGPAIGLNDSTDDYGSTDSMTIAFRNPVNSFADFFNYDPDETPTTPTTINVFDAAGHTIGSYILSFSTNGAVDSGEWLTFSSTTPIGSFTMTDNYISMASPTPEPASLTYFALAASAFAAATLFSRRKASARPSAV